MQSSSEHLHPKTGARYVFTREAEAYNVVVFQAGGTTLQTCLRWEPDGRAMLEPSIDDPMAHEQIIKLARVVKRTGQARLTRWRE